MKKNHATESFEGPENKKSGETALKLEKLNKTFQTKHGHHKAVDDINLEIKQGEFLTLLGPSGCGKTTILRLVAGFEYPTSGNVILDGQIINQVPPNKRPMAMVFQGFALFPHMSVYENVAYGLKVKSIPANEISERVGMVMNLMNLTGMEDRKPHEMSGGQQQRVALARALVMRPRVLLFDEPLSNLDAKLRVQMRVEIRRLQQQLGITSLYVTHDQSEAMGLSDRIVVMNNGRIEQVGSPSEIYQRPTTVFVADFVGQSNFIKGSIVACGTDWIELDLFGKTIRLTNQGHSFDPGMSVYLVIRPEAVKLSRKRKKNQGLLQGKVEQAEYLGSHINYQVELAGNVRISIFDYNPNYPEDSCCEGDTVFLELPDYSFHVLLE